jgi:hypothetical protein
VDEKDEFESEEESQMSQRQRENSTNYEGMQYEDHKRILDLIDDEPHNLKKQPVNDEI